MVKVLNGLQPLGLVMEEVLLLAGEGLLDRVEQVRHPVVFSYFFDYLLLLEVPLIPVTQFRVDVLQFIVEFYLRLHLLSHTDQHVLHLCFP